MWTCEHCGCQAIALGLAVCPQCGRKRVMPKTTVAGSSNAWEDPPGTINAPGLEEPPDGKQLSVKAPGGKVADSDAAVAGEAASVKPAAKSRAKSKDKDGEAA